MKKSNIRSFEEIEYEKVTIPFLFPNHPLIDARGQSPINRYHLTPICQNVASDRNPRDNHLDENSRTAHPTSPGEGRLSHSHDGPPRRENKQIGINQD